MGPVSTASPLLLSFLSSLATAQVGTPTPKQSASTTLSCDRFHKTGFWDIDIDEWPALAPECGPPISRNALRDRSKLPVQICGIVASYLFFVSLVGVLLVTVGRRARNKAQGSVGKPPRYEIEMVKPQNNFEPLSPYSQRSWIKAPFKTLQGSALSRASSFAGSPVEAPSPAVGSIGSLEAKSDDAAHRESRQAELERLYAAVMAHEDVKRSAGPPSLAPSVKPAESIAPSPSNKSVPLLSLPQNPRDSKRSLRVQIAPAEPQTFEHLPKSPHRAIYPPYSSPGGQSMQDLSPMTPVTPRRAGHYVPSRQHDMWPLPSPGPGPMSPTRIELPNDMYPASPLPRQVQMQLPSTMAPPLPPPPAGRQSSSSGRGGSRKLNLQSLRISAPQQQDEFDDQRPLTPRTFTSVAPPPPPPAYGVRFQAPQLSAASMDSYNSERLDQPKPLPMPTVQSHRRPSNLSLSLSPGSGSIKSASSSVNTLPLRAFQNASTEDINPMSPGIIKTTYLEKKTEKVGRGPTTGRTPRTGVPPTPYSAYMPFTPITPVTPGLVSRKARKERIKAQGRHVLVEEDEVKDDEDMWDAGY